MKIYVAGPLNGSGDRDVNVRRACFVGTAIRDAGHVPFVPHTNVVWHAHYPAEEATWLAWDFAWLDACDALVRLPGHSPGSDREVKRAETNKQPIYFLHDLEGDLEEWLRVLVEGQLP